MMAVISPVLRNEYIVALEKARQNYKPFRAFVAEAVIESEKDMHRAIGIEIPTMIRINHSLLDEENTVQRTYEDGVVAYHSPFASSMLDKEIEL